MKKRVYFDVLMDLVGPPLLVDDNLGLYRHRIETNKLQFVQPIVVKSLQKLLIGYPNWEILVALGREFGGLVIRNDEIMDGFAERIFPRNSRCSNMREAVHRDRNSAISCIRALDRFSLERAARLDTAAGARAPHARDRHRLRKSLCELRQPP